MKRTFARLLVSFGILTMVAAAPTTAQAVPVSIFSNLGNAPGYDISQANLVGDDFSGSCAGGTDCWIGQGVSFVAGVTANLASIHIALSYPFSAPVSDLLVNLTTNVAGQPGAVLESFTVMPASLGLLGNSNPLVDLTSVLMPLLTSGTSYWLTVNASVSGGFNPETVDFATPVGLPAGNYQVTVIGAGLQSVATMFAFSPP